MTAETDPRIVSFRERSTGAMAVSSTHTPNIVYKFEEKHAPLECLGIAARHYISTHEQRKPSQMRVRASDYYTLIEGMELVPYPHACRETPIEGPPHYFLDGILPIVVMIYDRLSMVDPGYRLVECVGSPIHGDPFVSPATQVIASHGIVVAEAGAGSRHV